MRLKDPHLPAAAGPPSLLLFFACPARHLTSLCWVLAAFVGAVPVLPGSWVLRLQWGHLTGYDRWQTVSECPLSPFILGYLSWKYMNWAVALQ